MHSAPPARSGARCGDQLTEIGELLDAQRIKPVIDKVFPFDQAKEALEYLAKGHARGKVVVSIKP